MATATDDNAEIRNLDARLFEKSTCWHTRTVTAIIILYDHFIIPAGQISQTWYPADSLSIHLPHPLAYNIVLPSGHSQYKYIT